MNSKIRAIKLQGRVLVVDDCSDGRITVSRVLRCIGLEAETAENGQVAHDTALRALAEGRPFDLILMDMQMPVMDGFTATALLRKHCYSGRIVGLTGMEGAREQCLCAGCDDFAAKPITFEMLFDLVERNTGIQKLSA